MTTFNVSVESASPERTVFRVGFGEPGTNDTLVKDASEALKALGDVGGKLALMNGPASLPVACVLAHHLSHRFGAVGCFDPKLQAFVVAITHDPTVPIGTVIPKGDA